MRGGGLGSVSSLAGIPAGLADGADVALSLSLHQVQLRALDHVVLQAFV